MASPIPKRDETTGRREYPVPLGPTLLDVLWGRLDEITRELMRIATAADKAGEREEYLAAHDFDALKGEALGVAWSISVIETPYEPDVDAVRSKAMQRFSEQNLRG